MLLELSEVFVCPRCRPAQGLVVMVDRLEGRRVAAGRLGCPGCDLRVPVRAGTVRFDRARPAGQAGEEGPEPAGEEGPEPAGEAAAGGPEAGEGSEATEPLPPLLRAEDPEEAAVRLAALLGADRAEGYLLLGPSLGSLAAGVAARAPEAEVLALGRGAPGEPAEGVGWAAGTDPEDLPVITGRLGGAALAAPSAAALGEGARVLREGARLVILEPGPGLEEELEELPVRPAVREERAVVAVRRAGGFEEPFARFPGGPRPRSGETEQSGPDGPAPG